MMKTPIRICLATTVLIAAAAHAQSAPQSAHSANAETANTPQLAQSATDNGNWTPPNGEPVREKTRAQVYQELIKAQKDGQLASLDSTVYAHH